MAGKLIYITIIFTLLASSIRTSKAYDYFKLVHQWPKSFCSLPKNKCYRTPAPLNFTLHGLWPEIYGPNSLTNCKKVPFDLNMKLYLIARLDYSWPDLRRSSYDTQKYQSFWEHEWNEHGICSQPPFTQTKYFEKALELKDRYDVLGILGQKGIRNGHRISVSLKLVNDSIFQATGGVPRITCPKNKLYQIEICFDHDGALVINCPQKGYSSCNSQQVLFE